MRRGRAKRCNPALLDQLLAGVDIAPGAGSTPPGPSAVHRDLSTDRMYGPVGTCTTPRGRCRVPNLPALRTILTCPRPVVHYGGEALPGPPPTIAASPQQLRPRQCGALSLADREGAPGGLTWSRAECGGSP